ncbi:hypothetical protein BJX66DRAFT_297690 [Aspergillus keveii]|uniref:Uncharacterized protein n=1 Tax=Aspergillus keveii TaxID=714993 RepID=A0ABR4GE93_9EURO
MHRAGQPLGKLRQLHPRSFRASCSQCMSPTLQDLHYPNHQPHSNPHRLQSHPP